jgi:uncharacterized membrane protein
MNVKQLAIAAAVSGLLTTGVASSAAADDMAASGKCYGVAKAGKNEEGQRPERVEEPAQGRVREDGRHHRAPEEVIGP